MDLAADEEQQLFRVLEEGASGLLLPGIGFSPFSALHLPPPRPPPAWSGKEENLSGGRGARPEGGL